MCIYIHIFLKKKKITYYIIFTFWTLESIWFLYLFLWVSFHSFHCSIYITASLLITVPVFMAVLDYHAYFESCLIPLPASRRVHCASFSYRTCSYESLLITAPIPKRVLYFTIPIPKRILFFFFLNVPVLLRASLFLTVPVPMRVLW
jgi:hypothetical protein